MFAEMSAEAAVSVLASLALLGIAVKAIYEHRMLKSNPEAWRVMKAAEEDAKERKRAAMGKGVMGVASIAKMFLKK